MLCNDADRLKLRTVELLAETRRLAESAARMEAQWLSCDEAYRDHRLNCDLCQDNEKPTVLPPFEPLLGLL